MKQWKIEKRQFAICIDNADYEASLILRKIYEIIPDEPGEKDDLIRIVDESGEDYLYHKSMFDHYLVARLSEGFEGKEAIKMGLKA